MVIGYAVGSFDLLNVRDLDVIAQAGERCSSLLLGVLTDDAAEALHGRRPVVPLVERMALLEHVRGVAEVVVHDVDVATRADLLFVTSPAAAVLLPEPVELLVPRRDTASPMLRAALSIGSGRDAGVEAVA